MGSCTTTELPLFTAGVMIERIRDTFRHLPDARKGGNNQRYTMEDAALGAFAVFFTQSPSFLDYQVRMQKERGRNNATALFGVQQIPSDQQIRNLLETVEGLYHLDALENHRIPLGGFAVALDGVEYFSSQAISGPNCCTCTHANGQTRHFHVAVTPVLVAPGQASVFPLPPAFVGPQDGHDKPGLRTGGQWALVAAMGAADRPLGRDLPRR